MSNIPAPGSGYSDYSYGGAFRNNFGADPYGAYNARENFASGNSGDVEAYKQQLQAYYQNLLSVYNSLAAGDSRRAQCEQYLQTTREYAEQVDLQLRDNTSGIGSQWDPNGGAVSSGLNIPISYQDANHIVTDEGPSTDITVRQTDSITKLIDVYQADNTLTIPSNAAVVSVNQVTSGTDVKWEVTIVLNGVTRKITYHNVQREGFSLNIQAANPDQVTTNAALSGGPNAAKFTKTELGTSSSGGGDQAGDRYTRMDGQVRVFDGVSYEIAPVQTGSNKETKVLASGDVSIIPNSNEECYTMAYQAGPPSKYIVTVYATEADKTAGRKKETITIDGALVDHISFGGDPSRMEYLGALATAGDPHTLNATAPGASKITAGGADELGGALNPDHETDTTPDSTVGNTATYNTSANVDVHTNFDDAVNTHRITAPGEVKIHTSSYADTVTVTRSGSEPNYTYTVIVVKNGNLTEGVETYVVSGPPSKIIIDGLPAKINPIGAAATDPIIQRGLTTTTETDTANSADEMLAELKTILGGKTDAQILSALNSNGFSFANIDALKAAMNATPPTFPPAFDPAPGSNFEKLVKALYALDGQLSGRVNASLPWSHPVIGPAYKQGTQRLVELLQQLYPDHNISMTFPNATDAQWRLLNNVSFDGRQFNWTNQSQGHVGEVRVSAASPDGSNSGEGGDRADAVN